MPYQYPNYGTPQYNAPVWNESAVDALTQKRAASGLRQLRQQIQKVTSRRYDNPQVGRMTLRDALQGYGSAVDKVMSGASEAASSEYGKQYGYEIDAAKTQFQAAYDQWKTRQTLGAQKEAAEKQAAHETELAKMGGEREKELLKLRSGYEKELTGMSGEREKELLRLKSGYEAERERELLRLKNELEYSPMKNPRLREAYERKLLKEYEPTSNASFNTTYPWTPLGRA